MRHSILVINDEPATRYLLRLLLESVGFAVTEAEYGVDAYRKAHQSPPDAVIFDVNRQDDTRFAICKPATGGHTLRSLAMLTATTKTAVSQEILQESVTHYLPKPLGRQDLAGCLQQLLSNRRVVEMTGD